MIFMAIEGITSKIWEFINIPVIIINNLLTSMFPNNEVPALFILSFVIGFFLKKRYKVGKVEYVILSLMVFGFMRYLGISN